MSGRPKRPVILRKENAVKRFDSIAEAARWLGIKPPSVSSALKHKQRHNTVSGFTVEYENPIPPEKVGFVPKRVRKEKKEKEDGGYWDGNMNPYKNMEVEVYGKKYKSIPVENKTSCKGCDILKDSNGCYQPFCFDYSCGKHKIVEICRGHQMLWKRN